MHLKDVGFVGLAGSGKDTAALALIELGWALASFATPIKLIAQSHFGWNQKKDEKGRKLLQEIGSAGRAYSQNLWIDKARNESSHLRRVWTDVRFQNEVDFLLNERKAVVIRIVRPGLKAGKHESESGQADLVGVTHEVVNDGTIEDLHRKVVNILNA
jgi:dephospho-CoA kinase